MVKEYAEVDLKINDEGNREKLEKLQQKAAKLREQFADAFKKGDTQGIEKINKELQKTTREIENMVVNAANIRAAMKKLDEATPKELQRTLKLINSELNSGRVKRGSEEWNAYIAKLKEVKAELRKVQQEQQESVGFLSRMTSKFTNWWGTYTIMTDAIAGVQMKFSQMRKDRNDKQESQANLKALTGLDDASISWLTQQAERLATTMDETGLRVTQSSREILDAYMLVGSNKPELLTDKEALNAVTVEAMRLSTAAKMKLQPAVDAMTTALNQFGQGADKAADFVNVLAAGSKFGASNVEQQAASILKSGTAAASANVSFEELVGSIEMLGEKGIKGEIAGTGLKKFFLVLQTGAAETNPKVVGLSTALDNLKAKVDEAEKKTVGGGAAFLKKMFGEEAFAIGSILANNTEKVKEYTAAVTATQTATEQAAINSDTSAAKMAQLRNKIKETGIELMEKLNPSLGILANWSSKFISILPTLFDIIVKTKSTVLALASALLVYNAFQKRVIIHSKIQAMWNLKVDESFKKLWKTLRANPWGVVLTIIGAAIGVIVDYYKAQQRVNMGEKDQADIREKARENMAQEKTQLELLLAAARNENLSLQERHRAIDKLNQIVPDYNAHLDDTTGKYTENKEALDEYNKALVRKYELEGAKEKLAEIGKEKAETKVLLQKAQDDLKDAQNSAKSGTGQTYMTSYGMVGNTTTHALDAAEARVDRLGKKLERIEDREKAVLNAYGLDLQKDAIENAPENSGGGTGDGGDGDADTALKKLQADLKKVKEDYLRTQEEIEGRFNLGLTDYATYTAEKKKLDEDYLENQIRTHEANNKVDLNGYVTLLAQKVSKKAKAEEEQKKLEEKLTAEQLKKTLKEYELEQKKEQDAAVAAFYDTSNILYQNQTALNRRLYLADMDYLSKKKMLYAEGSDERAAAEREYEERENQEKIRKAKELAEAIERFRTEYGDRGRQAAYMAELKALELLHKKKLIKEEEYQKALLKLQTKYRTEGMSEAFKDFEKLFSRLAKLSPKDMSGMSEKFTKWLNSLSDQEREAISAGFEKGFDNIVGNIMIQGFSGMESLIESFNEMSAGNWEGLLGKLEEMAQSAANIIGGVMTTFSAYWNAQRDIELAEIEKRYDSEIEAAGKNSKKKEKLEKERQAEIAKVKNKYNDRAMKMEVAQAIAQTAANALGAFGAMVKIPFVGPGLAAAAAAAATAAGMIQVATIKKQHEAEAAGYYAGGFTRRDPDNRRVVGEVHANEFVANHQAVANPVLSPILKMIDRAQRNNTVGSLTAADVNRALGTPAGVGAGGGPTAAPADYSAAMSGALVEVAATQTEVRTTLSRLVQILEQGIEATMVMDGQQGFDRKYNKFKDLTKAGKR